ncbi:MAG: 3-isopropylmalate dehydratase large subunit [Gammaproteobacteria bacterium]
MLASGQVTVCAFMVTYDVESPGDGCEVKRRAAGPDRRSGAAVERAGGPTALFVVLGLFGLTGAGLCLSIRARWRSTAKRGFPLVLTQPGMAHTLSEKIIARAAGRDGVAPGEIVTCRVDLAMMHDSSGPRRMQPMLERIGARVWDPDRVVIISDHFVHEPDADSQAIQSLTRSWVQAHPVRAFHDGVGICHVVLPEQGHVRPGMLAVGGDSHSVTAGAFGCFMVGVGASDLAGVLASGEIWLRVPASVRVQVEGALAPGVAAKDVILALCARIGINGANYRAVSYAGSTIDAMSMSERMTLTNMSAELGAKTGVIAPDRTTQSWLAQAGVDVHDIDRWRDDDDAQFERVIDIDANELGPQVAAPHSPANSTAVETWVGEQLDQAFIGACTGAKLDDLRMAAEVLSGQRIADGLALFVAPASQRTKDAATADGTLSKLVEAGATVLPSGCGACIGFGPARLEAGRTGISTSSRNFRGRMGDLDSRTFLASAYTVAASAVVGCIADPRDYLGHGTRGA